MARLVAGREFGKSRHAGLRPLERHGLAYNPAFSIVFFLSLLSFFGCQGIQKQDPPIYDGGYVNPTVTKPFISFVSQEPDALIFIKPSVNDWFFVDEELFNFFSDLRHPSNSSFNTLADRAEDDRLMVLSDEPFKRRDPEFIKILWDLEYSHMMTYRIANKKTKIIEFEVHEIISDDKISKKPTLAERAKASDNLGKVRRPWLNDDSIIGSSDNLTQKLCSELKKPMSQFRKSHTAGEFCNTVGFFLTPDYLEKNMFTNKFLDYFSGACSHLNIPRVSPYNSDFDWNHPKSVIEELVTKEGKRFGFVFDIKEEELSEGDGRYAIYYFRSFVYDSQSKREILNMRYKLLAKSRLKTNNSSQNEPAPPPPPTPPQPPEEDVKADYPEICSDAELKEESVSSHAEKAKIWKYCYDELKKNGFPSHQTENAQKKINFHKTRAQWDESYKECLKIESRTSQCRALDSLRSIVDKNWRWHHELITELEACE